MPTIGNNQFPYPNTSDEPNIPGDLQKLALAVDTAMGGGNRLIDTLATLQAIPASQLFEGMRATVTSDATTLNNGEYMYAGGTWIQRTRDVSSLFTVNGLYTLSYLHAVQNGKTVTVTGLVTRTTSTLSYSNSWDESAMLKCDASVAMPTDMHFVVASNANYHEQLLLHFVNTSIGLRCQTTQPSMGVGGWVQFSFSYNLA